jgi:sodium/proline symporter
MDSTSIVIATLVIYQLALIAIGFWASRRTHDEEDFFLAGRGLGPVVAAISYSSSASSAWTLLGMSGAAYVMGVSVLWIAGGSLLGMLVAWFWVAPRLMRFSREQNCLTLTEFLVHGSRGRLRTLLLLSASLIIIVSFAFYVAAQFQGAGNTFASTFDMPMEQSIVLGATIIMVYTLLGGFWAVSVTDTVQGLLMAAAAVLLPVAALIEVGGVSGFLEGLRAVSSPAQLSFTAGNAGLMAVGVMLGGLSIGLGTYGQPHLLVRFMALRDERALVQARWITIFWYFLVFMGMCFLGLVGHVLHAGVDNPETIFFVLTESLFSPVVSAILLAAVLSAIMSTADSQLLVAASTLAHDLGLGRRYPGKMLLISRLAIVLLVVLSVVVAIYMPEKIFNRALFAWVALGAAFGPLLFFRLMKIEVSDAGALLAMLTGFGLAIAFYLLPNTPGDIAERLLPFVIGVLMLYFSRKDASALSGDQP